MYKALAPFSKLIKLLLLGAACYGLVRLIYKYPKEIMELLAGIPGAMWILITLCLIYLLFKVWHLRSLTPTERLEYDEEQERERKRSNIEHEISELENRAEYGYLDDEEFNKIQELRDKIRKL